MPKINFEVIVEDDNWNNCVPEYNLLVDKSMENLCENSVVPEIYNDKNIHINIVLSNDDNIQILNRDFRSKDKATNVLSFALIDDDEIDLIISQCEISGEDIPVGDIFIALETIKKEAKNQNKNLNNHFQHMLVHGVLHIFGYDHINGEDAKIMEDLEIKILDSLNIGNPYK